MNVHTHTVRGEEVTASDGRGGRVVDDVFDPHVAWRTVRTIEFLRYFALEVAEPCASCAPWPRAFCVLEHATAAS